MPPDVVGVAGEPAGSAEGNDSIGEEVRGAAVWAGPDGIGVAGPSVGITAPVQAPIKIGVASVAAIKY